MNYLKTMALAGAAALALASNAQAAPGIHWVPLGHFSGATGWVGNNPLPAPNGYRNVLMRLRWDNPDNADGAAETLYLNEVDCAHQRTRFMYSESFADDDMRQRLRAAPSHDHWTLAQPGTPAASVVSVACGSSF